jgi:hypothetical protein
MITDIEYILCSAIWYNDEVERAHLPINIPTGLVVCGLRHCNCFTVLAALFPNREYIIVNEEDIERRHIQGFLTSKNRFVDRTEGYNIAVKAEQCTVSEHEILMSEDIW